MTLKAQHKVLILGGGYAGMMAAARITRGRSNADVTLIDARPALRWTAPGASWSIRPCAPRATRRSSGRAMPPWPRLPMASVSMVKNELRMGIPLYRWPGSGRTAMVQSSARAEVRSQG